VVDFSQVQILPLSKDYDFGSFNCGDKDINEFFKTDALVYNEQKIASTFLFVLNNEILGFFSVAADSIKLKVSEKESHNIQNKPISEFPAAKIARIGRDVKYKNQKIGENILKWAVGYIMKCSEMMAVRFVTVDSYVNRAAWYEQFGFTRNLEEKYIKRDNHVSMRYDLLNPPI